MTGCCSEVALTICARDVLSYKVYFNLSDRSSLSMPGLQLRDRAGSG